MKVLVTGGAGYIGSHFVKSLLEQQIDTVVVDDLSASARETVPPTVAFLQARVGDCAAIGELLAREKPNAVVHFAGSIQVGESVHHPDLYYANNFVQTLGLLNEVVRAGVGSFVFSSTAAVYGDPDAVPISEDHPKRPLQAYGASKLAVEMALADYQRAYGLRCAALRYFNAAGAHPSGELRERHAPETHLVPLAIDAAVGAGPQLILFGQDWPTPDGSCIRDYIHVSDLAAAHLLTLDALARSQEPLFLNLGTGIGLSVLEIVRAVEQVTGRTVPLRIGPRRPGDPPRLVAAVDRAARTLLWRACRSDVLTMIEDAVRSRTGRSKG
jgi:UDP-glucose 4-epimerase